MSDQAIDTDDQTQDQGESYTPPAQDQGESYTPPADTQGGNPSAPFGAPSGNDEMRSADPKAFDKPVVVAHVTLPGTSQQSQIPLTASQFADYLHPGKDGQWDKLMQTSIPATLQNIAGSYMGAPQAAGGDAATQTPINEDENAAGDKPSTPEEQSGTVTREEYQTPTYSGKLSDDQAQEKQSYAIFPRAALDAGENAKREEWIAAQNTQSANRENAVEVATEKGKWADKRAATAGGYKNLGEEIKAKGGVDKAGVYSAAKVQAAQAGLEKAAAHEEAINGRSQKAQQLRALQTQVATEGTKSLTPEQKPLWDSFTTGGGGAPASPAKPAAAPAVPQAQDPQKGLQQAAQAAPQDPSQRVVGTQYKSKSGRTGTWSANGWVNVQ